MESIPEAKLTKERIIIELTERIRLDEEGRAIILVGHLTGDGLVFNDWWLNFRTSPIHL